MSMNATSIPDMENAKKPISSLRWWIGGLLFASTVINYIDRQTLSLLAPYLKIEYHWTNTDYANLAIAFRVAYSIGQSVFGRLMDRVGNAARTDADGDLVFDRFHIDIAGPGILQLCYFSFSARGRASRRTGRRPRRR